MVVLPEASGPKISVTRPRGIPPTPRAASSEIAPVEMTAISHAVGWAPNRMMAPLPNCRSIWATARLSAFSFPSLDRSIPLLEVSTTDSFAKGGGLRLLREADLNAVY